MDFVGWLDRGAADAAFRLHQPWLNEVMVVVTQFGDRIVLAPVVLAAVVVLWMRRLRRTALLVAATALVGLPLSEGAKYLVHRQRPQVDWRLIELPSSPSFPSGHALESAVVYGSLALIVGRRRRGRWRWVVYALGLLLPLLVGFSRVYLGVHFFTDVLAGWAVGLVLALLGAWADRCWSDGRAPPLPAPRQ